MCKHRIPYKILVLLLLVSYSRASSTHKTGGVCPCLSPPTTSHVAAISDPVPAIHEHEHRPGQQYYLLPVIFDPNGSAPNRLVLTEAFPL